MAAPGMLAAAAVPHSPLSPSAAAQYFEYPAAYANQFANGFEAAAYPYSTASNGYVAPAAAYTYAVHQPVAAGAGGHFAHFQSQQIQERMQ